MLVLTRRSGGDPVFIGDDIEISVLSVNGSQVRIGITAPKNVNIVRGECIKKSETKEEESYG